jgi:hypothetical protein
MRPGYCTKNTARDIMKGVGKRGLWEEEKSSMDKWGNCTAEEPFR